VDPRERVDAGLETAGFEPADPTEPQGDRTPGRDASEATGGPSDDSAGDGGTDVPETARVGDIIEEAEGGDGFADGSEDADGEGDGGGKPDDAESNEDRRSDDGGNDASEEGTETGESDEREESDDPS